MMIEVVALIVSVIALIFAINKPKKEYYIDPELNEGIKKNTLEINEIKKVVQIKK